MASDMATRRLRKELMAIKRTPIDNIVVSFNIAGSLWLLLCCVCRRCRGRRHSR